MMHMEQHLSQTQQQRQLLAPQMQQALQMLQMNSIELDQYIEQVLEANPFLDRVASSDTVMSDVPETAATDFGDSEERIEENYEQAVLGRSENESSRDGDWDISDRHREGPDFSRNTDRDEAWQYYENSITREESLRAHLLGQMHLAAVTPRAYEIGERIIIGDMDDNGFFTGHVEEIAEELHVDVDEVVAVLDTIKKFEPTGVGAADIQECLLLQIEVEYPEEDALKTLVADYWDDFVQGRIPKVARDMGVTAERIMEIKELLARLDPFPGREYSSEPPAYIQPEIIVEKVDDDYIVMLTSDDMPPIAINSGYIKDVRSKKISSEERAYVRHKLEGAKWLLHNIERRQDTIRKTAQAIVDTQRMFMQKGVEYMKPLTLEEIARKVGVHESTVSRTVNGKYIQTPQGLFELKYFFSSGLRSDDGEAQSSTAVGAHIKTIIEHENKSKPLSDQKITDMLKERGTQVARRTVTKYREQLHILPAKMRRAY